MIHGYSDKEAFFVESWSCQLTSFWAQDLTHVLVIKTLKPAFAFPTRFVTGTLTFSRVTHAELPALLPLFLIFPAENPSGLVEITGTDIP
jgi:hypothetical protein